jgi:hypothetical protein
MRWVERVASTEKRRGEERRREEKRGKEKILVGKPKNKTSVKEKILLNLILKK